MKEGFNIDNISLASMEREVSINNLYKTFEKQKEKSQPKPEDFFDLPGFDKEQIEKEIEKVKKYKEGWEANNSDKEKENKKISDVFEGIIVNQFGGSWMANKAEAFFASEPDDILRKVDCVIEFDAEEDGKHEYLGLGIDVTFSSDYSIVRSKLADAWKDVENSKKVVVKYVDTENYTGSLDVCRVVLSADKETVYHLASLRHHNKIEELDNDPFLANILLQIKYQIESYYRFCQKKHANAEYLKHLTKTLSTFYSVYEEKEEFAREKLDDVMEDENFKTIKNFCDEKEKEF